MGNYNKRKEDMGNYIQKSCATLFSDTQILIHNIECAINDSSLGLTNEEKELLTSIKESLIEAKPNILRASTTSFKIKRVFDYSISSSEKFDTTFSGFDTFSK